MKFARMVSLLTVFGVTCVFAQSSPLSSPSQMRSYPPSAHPDSHPLVAWPVTTATSPTGPRVVSGGIPTLNAPLRPTSVKPGSPAFTLRVLGTGFVPGAVVNWNRTPLATTFLNQGRLLATVPASNVANPATANITVTNPGSTGGTSSPLLFTVTAPTHSLTFITSTLNVGLGPNALVSGDFNNDGKTDLAVLNTAQPNSCYSNGGVGTIQILLGNGASRFSTASSACFPDQFNTTPLQFLAAQDFEGTGKLGVAGEWWGPFEVGPNLTIYPGNGDGTVSESWAFGLTDYPLALPVAFADFNNSGRLDFAYTQVDQIFCGGVLLYLGSGNGTFAFDLNTSPNVYGSATLAGDFNGDGILDVAVTDFQEFPSCGFPIPDVQGQLGIVLGTGGGSFAYADPAKQPSTTLVTPAWMVAGDFNRDGILDLAFADSGSTGLTVLLGNGDGTFTQKLGQPSAAQTTQFIATADLNGDGKLDLVLVNSANAVLIFLGNGDGTFQTPLEVGAGNGASQVAIGDFNGDGHLDLAVTNNIDNTVSLLIQAPTATVSPASLKFPPRAVGATSGSQRITVRNAGSAMLQIANITPKGDFSDTTTCGASLPMGQYCFIDVTFKPTATGLRTGNITISDNAGDNPQVVPLSGTGH